MSETRKKLAALSNGNSSKDTEKVLLRRANREWLRKSQAIALHILSALREQNMSQKNLAERMNVSPQHINKIVKGGENLTLETIAAIEKVLGIVLLDIPKFEKGHPYKVAI